MDYKTKIFALKLLPKPLRRWVVVRRYRAEVEVTGEVELLQLRKLVGKGDLALDIGSNLGVYAYELHRLTGSVIAFEPNPVLAGLLTSIAPQGMTVHPFALSSHEQDANLEIPLDNERGHGWASVRPGFVEGDVESVQVQLHRLDSLRLPPISFIKVDVEGSEQDVIEGGMETIARDLPFLLIEIGHEVLDSISANLAPLGYTAAFFHEGIWKPISEFDPDRFQNMELWHEAMRTSPTRRDLAFINNFLFLPPHRQIAELN